MTAITTEELAALNDQLSIEASLSDRYLLYAKACRDPQLQIKYQELAAHHRSHCKTLLSLLPQEGMG